MNRISGLYAIVDSTVTPNMDLAGLARDYLQGGASMIQLRDKKRLESPLARRLFLETARRLAALRQEFSFTLIINDDLEVADEVDADGVHVGQDDLSIEECRKIFQDKIIGYSSHSLEEALEAEKRGADYVAFGAIFPTATKGPGHPVQGLEKLREVVSRLKVPVVAIGGIGRHNIQDVLATGVSSIAMISALAEAGNDPQGRTETVRYFSGLF